MSFFTCPTCFISFKDCAITSAFSASIWYTMWMGNTILSEVIERYISWVKRPITRLIVGMIGTIVYSVSVVALLVTIWQSLMHFYFGELTSIILSSLVITFIVSLVMHSRAFLINWKESLLSMEKLKRESVAAQYESLKNQVNPHFLFNSLNVLTGLVYEDADKSAKFIKQLADVYRYVLDTRGREVVTIEEELKFVNSYLYLQQIRFGDNLKVNINISDLKKCLPPLALQMLIENAIKHNIVSSENPLTINIESTPEYLMVSNNLQRKTSLGETSSGLGLENIRHRYQYLSDRPVNIVSNDELFKVELPWVDLTA